MFTRQYKSDPEARLEELRNISFDPDDPKFKQRVELVSMVVRGEKSPAQVAEEAGCSKRSVQGWVSAMDENGWDALRSAPVLGRPNRLSAEQMEEVKQAVLNAKEKDGKEWTAQTLATYISETYKIEYGASAATKLMARLGLARRKPGRPPGRSKRPTPSTKGSAQKGPTSGDTLARRKPPSGGSPRKQYKSDVTREQYELIRPLLESVTVHEIDLYDTFCAVLYILVTGAQWENLPGDFPNHKTVYHYFHLWTSPGEDGISVFAKCLVFLRNLFRNNMGRKSKLTLGIVDAKSIKNVDTAKEKGYDAGKKYLGLNCISLWIRSDYHTLC